MTEGGSTGAARPYNRPRRYPVPTATAADPPGPNAAEVTRQNPTLAEAAQDYERRYGEDAAPQAPTPPYPHPAGTAAPPLAAAGPSVAVSRRGLLIGLAVLLAIAAVGLVVGLSGGDGSTRSGAPVSAPAGPNDVAPASSIVPVTPSAVPTTSTSTAPGGGAAPGGLCTRLGATAPFTAYVTQPRPTAKLPVGYLEPQAGMRVGLCLGRFRPGAGAGRGTLAYLIEYDQLPATQYAAELKTTGWVTAPTLPQNTFRKLTTTVTLVQQGTTLITVVGTGR